MRHALYALALLLAAAPAGAQDQEGQVLDGWRDMKFGMSPEQARALPGRDFGRYSRKDLLDRNNGAMGSKKPELVNGVAYNFNLYFNSFERLYDLGFWHQTPTSQADCEGRFLTLLQTLEKSYGKFAPVYPPRTKNDQDQLPMSIIWKNAPGVSRYQEVTAYLASETAHVWDARRLFNGRYIDAAAVWSAEREGANALCLTEIDVRS
ncbi:MAG TPA: hypothetical protein VG501_00935 [Rhizomicrobium sp.]|nr:hypothetical protein [Rhizomicrobium sp.]